MISLLFVLSFQTASADDGQKKIERAYQREYAYLAAERQSLLLRQKKQTKQHKKTKDKLEKEIVDLEAQLSVLQTVKESNADKLDKLQEQIAAAEEQETMLQAVIDQGRESLSVELTEATKPQALAQLISASIKSLETNREIRVEKGSILMPDGVEKQGEIIRVGQSSAYGKAEGMYGALLPVGGGHLQLLDDWGEATAKSLFETGKAESLEMFVVEGYDKRIEESEDKTFWQTVETGGVIAWVIVILGMVGLLFAFVRAILLFLCRTSILVESKKQLQDKISTGQFSAQENVIPLHPDHDSLVDITDAILLAQKNKLDRFGSLILVIAAVAPLLGLLGTVSGMISTFEVITEHGTGDPRMLSGGISEALITTQLGLMVAIPMLLLGNLLNGWSARIHSTLTQTLLVEIAEQPEKKAAKHA